MNNRNKINRSAGAALAGTLIAFCSTLFALSPPPPQADDELLPLIYETLGGENWHNNDGWLNPEVHWCDWYGVDCGEEFFPGFYELNGLLLPDNNLNGELTEELARLLFVNMAPGRWIDLSGNAISGEMHFYPRLTPRVDLSGNALSGPLPPFEGEWVFEDYRSPRLYLQRNGFSGDIPPSWSNLRLFWLDLSDNELTGGHQNAIDAISPRGTSFVYLNGNPLEGELTTEVLTAPIAVRGESNVGGGIDICFTRLTVGEPEVRQWLADRHVASGDFEQCLDRDRTVVDATLSGSWYNPDRSGEGVSLMMLDNGAPLLYSFSFDTRGNQQWLFKVGHRGERFVDFEGIQETRGTFGEGIRHEDDYTFIRSTGDFRFDRIGRDSLSLHRHYYDSSACDGGTWEAPGGPMLLCPPPLHADRLDYQRLTELAGTTCEDQNEFQQYSGAWYNPERSGEGLVVEVLPDGRAVIYWFTYQPDDSNRQAWMIAEGAVDTPPDITLPTLIPEAEVSQALAYQPVGGTYGEDFDPQDIELVDWGSVSLTFYGPDSARLSWESNDPLYGSGNYELVRLARPMLGECE